MGLEINQNNSKFMRVETEKTNRNFKIKAQKENLDFENVEEFICLNCKINAQI